MMIVMIMMVMMMIPLLLCQRLTSTDRSLNIITRIKNNDDDDDADSDDGDDGDDDDKYSKKVMRLFITFSRSISNDVDDNNMIYNDDITITKPTSLLFSLSLVKKRITHTCQVIGLSLLLL